MHISIYWRTKICLSKNNNKNPKRGGIEVKGFLLGLQQQRSGQIFIGVIPLALSTDLTLFESTSETPPFNYVCTCITDVSNL